MAHPFRFGVQLAQLPGEGWRERLRGIEELGYASVLWPDHFDAQWEPVSALAAAAAATERIAVGSLVYDVDYRHPVVLAKAAATLQLLSGGRHEFGIGAGWMESDYRQAGIPYDRPGVRIARLEEALQVIRSMWENDATSFSGTHYTVDAVPKAGPLPPAGPPKVLVGGGGRKVLSLAGRHADIVGINPKLAEGRVTRDTAADLAPERVQEKARWVREAAEAAGRDPAAIELNSLVFVVALTDDPKPVREGIAAQTGMSVEQVADCPLFLTGPPSEVCDRLARRRERTGISYVVIQGRDPEVLERFAEGVVRPLTK